jgi:hypothetical protein
MDKNKLPTNYTPYEGLDVCSNTLINGKVPIEIQGHIPFLIGKGEMPQVWLSVPDSKGKWIDLIVSNKRVEIQSKSFKQYLLSIEESAEDKRIDISMWKTTILSVVQESENKAVIANLDLRPFNLLIYGDSEGLHIGAQILRENTMSNVHTMIGIGQ